MTFGQQLKIWRKAKGLTQEELASASGIKPAYMSNLERDFSTGSKGGKPMASEKLVERMAKVLNIDMDEMRLAAGYAPKRMAQVPKPIVDAIARSGTLSEKDAIFIAGIIEGLEKRNQNEN